MRQYSIWRTPVAKLHTFAFAPALATPSVSPPPPPPTLNSHHPGSGIPYVTSLTTTFNNSLNGHSKHASKSSPSTPHGVNKTPQSNFKLSLPMRTTFSHFRYQLHAPSQIFSTTSSLYLSLAKDILYLLTSQILLPTFSLTSLLHYTSHPSTSYKHTISSIVPHATSPYSINASITRRNNQCTIPPAFILQHFHTTLSGSEPHHPTPPKYSSFLLVTTPTAKSSHSTSPTPPLFLR